MLQSIFPLKSRGLMQVERMSWLLINYIMFTNGDVSEGSLVFMMQQGVGVKLNLSAQDGTLRLS